MSVQYPIIPIATNPVGIDAVVIDLQGLLNSNLSWLSDGLGRAYKINKVRSNGAAQILPLVYLGTSNYTYFSAQPDNDKQGQNFILVGDGLHINQQQGFYSILEYDISIIFSVNLKLINAPLLLTEDFTQNLIAQVRDVLLRQTLGKPYNIGQITETRLFGDVYSEFDILDDSPNTGKAMTEMAYFRFNFSTQIKEACPVPVLPAITCFSMDLDGVNELIQAPINSVFDLVRTDSMTFECWVKFDSLGALNRLVSKFGGLGARGILFMIEGVELRFDLQNNGGTNGLTARTTGANITAGVWYHFAVTYDGSENTSGVNFYVNGILQTKIAVSNTLTGSILAPNNLQIGGLLPTGGGFSNGLFNYVRVWKTELTPAEILTQYNGGAPLTNAVRFSDLILQSDSGNGATWNGSEFDILDATGITAGYTTVNAEEADKIENCPNNEPPIPPNMPNLYRYDFDGVNEKLALPTNTAYNFQNTDSFSLECWIEADNTTHIGGFICKYGNTVAPNLRGWIFSLVNDKIRLSLQNNGGANGASVFSPVGSILPNTLYHIVATYNGNLDTSGIELYINGVQQVKTIQFNNLTGDFDSTLEVSIGVIGNTGLYFDGKIDNVRIRNIILTPSQVLTAYNGGTAIAPIVGGLILDNRIGDGAIFGVDNWNDPDKSATISGTQSVNMEFIDRILT